MDQKIGEYFTGIIAQAQAIFDQVEYSTDATPARAILRGDWVEAGFDNSPDPRAIRLKYGHIGTEHRGENVPHLHHDDKTRLSLTVEMTFETFVDWLKMNVKST